MHNQTAAEAAQTVTKTHKPTCVFCGFERTNGRLLSIAPELLDAAADALDDLDNWHQLCGMPSMMDGVKRLRAAIAKAEGRA